MHACMIKGRSLCICILCNSQSMRYMHYDSTHFFFPQVVSHISCTRIQMQGN
jgi:hypothetical protein